MIAVTGATGNVGRELVRILTEEGAAVTALSRNPPDDRHHLRADLTEPASLRPVLIGAEALFLLLTGAFAAAGGSPAEILKYAADAGVRRVVLLSSQGVGTRPESESHGRIGRTWEDEVRRSGLEWTILRPGGFHSNAFGWAESIRAHRTVAAPFAEVGLPTVDPADIAAVAAAALRAPGHAGRIHVLTGPEAITPREQAAAIGAALGEPIHFAELSRAEAFEQMTTFMPAPIAETTLDILGAPTPEEARITPDVQRVLGRAPRPFAAWAERNADAFR
ncbi:SDR family oxidoreductase [Thermomonospora umbrina]|uniref:Uncharacterized protein YbjT (DUF2867 family) n=1 Tax=Thermomonospora umbrina TaxID=111806 RepID=A0A3D9SRZ2_9ACTN|nr:NAD(P)H-binding protein [Thermomonospora umbrina]REE96733.1 uncharacterized protein YbjT (DUF2867 family) [Thermomonospora umbrina]